MRRSWLIGLAASFLAAGCAPSLPAGPSMMVLPGNGKDFDSFAFDDAVCRQWGLQQIGAVPQQAATNAEVSSAVAGTALGAATGAAIGAAAGNPAMGAAAGAGVGLLGGSAAGANQAAGAEWSLQRRYDIAYMQCMYVKGNQIPVQAGYSPPAPTAMRQRPPAPPPPAGSSPPPTAMRQRPPAPPDVPPPPAGSPPRLLLG